MNTCGKVIGRGHGYDKTCGGLWWGEIVQCERCKNKDYNERIKKKKEEILDLQLAKLKEKV